MTESVECSLKHFLLSLYLLGMTRDPPMSHLSNQQTKHCLYLQGSLQNKASTMQ